MSPQFGENEVNPAPNPYTDWDWRLRRQANRAGDRDKLQILFESAAQNETSQDSTLIRPVFVVSKDPGVSTDCFFQRVDCICGVRFDGMEIDLNDNDLRGVGPVEAVLYVPATWFHNQTAPQDFLDLCHVVHVGPVLIRWPDSRIEGAFGFVPRQEKVTVMAGVIDDGLAFLNSRFRTACPDGSRFEAIWLQTLAQEEPGAATGSADVVVGSILGKEDIGRLIKRAERSSEESVYNDLRSSDEVLSRGMPLGIVRTAELSNSHGTSVLDLTAGADPRDPIDTEDDDYEDRLDYNGLFRNVPLIGCQLPPESVDDTSGVRLEIHIIQALRWMILAAHKIGVERLVVALSFGAAAGAKDGTRFLEQQIEREVLRAKRIKKDSIDVDVVLPFGNEYRSKLIARLDLASGKEAKVDLRLPRGDETASFVEVKSLSTRALPDGLKVSLVAPTGRATDPVEVLPGKSRSIVIDGTEIGRLYHISERPLPDGYDAQPPYFVLAFSPTTQPMQPEGLKRLQQLAPAGRWSLRFEGPEELQTSLLLQIQRDDSAFGYRGRGRQAEFDDRLAHARSDLFRDQSDLSDESAVTRQGTNTAYVSRRHAGVTVVSTARGFQRLGEDDNMFLPAYYASQGLPWSGGPPDVAHVVERTALRSGRITAGTGSGSGARLSGSSAAVALHARYLIERALGLPNKAIIRIPKQEDADRLGAKAIWNWDLPKMFP